MCGPFTCATPHHGIGLFGSFAAASRNAVSAASWLKAYASVSPRVERRLRLRHLRHAPRVLAEVEVVVLRLADLPSARSLRARRVPSKRDPVRMPSPPGRPAILRPARHAQLRGVRV